MLRRLEAALFVALLLAPPTLAAAETSASTMGAPAAPAGRKSARTSVLVLDLAPTNSSESEARIVSDTLATALSARKDLDVLTSADLRQAVGLEQEKQLAGCEDGSCLAELAGALGAELVVFGSVGRLGELTVVNLSLFESARARSAGRWTIEVKSLEDLPARLREVASEMFSSSESLSSGSASQEQSSGETPSSPLVSPLFLSGAAVTGLGLLSAGATLGLAFAADGVVRDPRGTDKSAAQGWRDGLAVASGASLVVAVVGVAIAIVGVWE